jgi:hypothetical protein
MAKTTLFTIGAEVSCTDGACGTVSGVVVDPAARAITHLVVDRDYQDQLVPLALVEATADGIRLRCTIAEFQNLDPPTRRLCRTAKTHAGTVTCSA